VLRRLKGLVPVLAVAGVLAGIAVAAVSLTQVSTDSYSSPTPGQHHTEVEPDTFAVGNTIVSLFQTGRFFDGGSTDVGWATSTDSGATWQHGALPGITKPEGGPYDRDTDPSIAYDAKHGVWLASTLALDGPQPVAVLTSRSTDGVHWSGPVLTATGSSPDKNWIACDNTSTSPFFGNCYTEWDDNGRGNRIKMNTSSDGGLTWGPSRRTADAATGFGGQPLVKSNGVVVVPIDDAFEGSVLYFTSTNGGASWTATKLVANISEHRVGGGIRSGPLPSAEIDKKNRIYIVWQDCRFRTGCSANDIVMATISSKLKVSSVVRIPIDGTDSGVDHFIPGIAVDRTTGGRRNPADLGLTYYYYPSASCSFATCQLDVGYVSSTDGGSTWSAPTQLAGPMSLSWLASTNQGPMVGDYISGSFSGGTVHPVFAVANAPNDSVFDEAMYSPSTGLPPAGGTGKAVTGPLLSASSDHALPATPVTAD
jgi:hypothetical protein